MKSRKAPTPPSCSRRPRTTAIRSFSTLPNRPSISLPRAQTHIARRFSSSQRNVNAKETSFQQSINTDQKPKPKVLIISGPTAMGKSEIACTLAAKLNGEIICVDSVVVYKGLNIASDKVSPGLRAQIPHYMVDMVEPTVSYFHLHHQNHHHHHSINFQEIYNASTYAQEATKAAEDILSRGKLPILVGGSGMYMRWFIYGGAGTPPDRDLREKWIKKVSEDYEYWKQDLQKTDPALVTRLLGHNVNRLARYLELRESAAGTPLSDLKQRIVSEEDLPYDYRAVFFYVPRAQLFRVVDYRVEKMIERGLVTEVLQLISEAKLQQHTTAYRAIGYRQTVDFLMAMEKHVTAHVPYRRLQELFMAYLEDLQATSRGLIRRQETWFRQEPVFCWTKKDPSIEENVKKLEGFLQMPKAEWEAEKKQSQLNKNTRDHSSLRAYNSIQRIYITPADANSILKKVIKSLNQLHSKAFPTTYQPYEIPY